MIRKIGVNNVEVVLHDKAEFQASMGDLMSYHWITFWYCKITWLINEIFLTAKWQSYKSENAKKIAAHHGKSFKKNLNSGQWYDHMTTRLPYSWLNKCYQMATILSRLNKLSETLPIECLEMTSSEDQAQ